MQLLTQHKGFQVFKTVVGPLMFSFSLCRMVDVCLDVSDERSCVHIQEVTCCFAWMLKFTVIQIYPVLTVLRKGGSKMSRTFKQSLFSFFYTTLLIHSKEQRSPF
jgi:hypothetical protein